MKKAIVLLLLSLLLPFGAWAEEADFAGAPGNIIHYDVNNKRFELSDYVQVAKEYPPIESLKGPVLVVFGAHWCEPCKELMKQLQARRAELDEAKVQVFYIHIDDVDIGEFERDSKEIKALVKEMAAGESYQGVRLLLAGDLQEAQAWMDDPSFNALPGAVMLAASGEVHERCGLKDFDAALGRFLEAVKPAAAESEGE
ncbi:MAG: redoxin domain-containing protein [Myxococcota bacterium]|nr:redoxin domain-containing protein [Myxococcota bacterium]